MSSKLLLLMALLLFSTQTYAKDPFALEYVEECKMPTLDIDVGGDLDEACRIFEEATKAGFAMKGRDNCAWPLREFVSMVFHLIDRMWDIFSEKKMEIPDECVAVAKMVYDERSQCENMVAITEGYHCKLPGSFESFCQGELPCLAKKWRKRYQGPDCPRELASVNFHVKHFVKSKLAEYNTSKIPAECQAVIDDSAGKIQPKYNPEICNEMHNTFSEDRTLADCPSILISDNQTAQCVLAGCKMDVLFNWLMPECLPLVVAMNKEHFENNGMGLQRGLPSKSLMPMESSLTSQNSPKKTATYFLALCFDAQRDIGVCHQIVFADLKKFIDETGLKSNEACVQFVDSDGTDVNFTKFEPLDHRCRRQLTDADGKFTEEDNKTMEDCPSKLLQFTDKETADCVDAACAMSIIIPKYKECFHVLVGIMKADFEKASIDSNTVCQDIINVEKNGKKLDFKKLTNGILPSNCDRERDDYVNKKLNDSQGFHDCVQVIETHGILDSNTRTCIEHSCGFFDMQNHTNTVCRIYDFENWKGMIKIKGLESNEACVHFVNSSGTDVNFTKFEPIVHRCRRQLADADGNFTNEDRQTMEDCPSKLLRLTDEQETAECVNAACTMTITPKHMDPDCSLVLVDIQKDAFEKANIDSNTVCKKIIESNGTMLDFSSLTEGKTMSDCSKEVADAQKKLTSEDNESIKHCNDVLSTHSFTDAKTKECIRFGCYAQVRPQYVSKACLQVMLNQWKTNFETQGLISNPACAQFTQSNGIDVDFEKFGTKIEKTPAAQKMEDTESSGENEIEESETTTAMNGHSSSAVSWTVNLALSVIYAVFNIAL